jgi:prepilin-type N-terminal cleavage/methylation domain-containing protein
MSLTDIKNLQREKGFTIVELLIVIVVIAILVAIVIVAYSGITQQANTSAAKANAQQVQKVAEAYAADEGNGAYPSAATLDSWTGGVTRLPEGVTLVGTTLTDDHADGKTIQYVPKGTTGVCIGYWNGSLGTPAAEYVYVGDASDGDNAATPTCG